MQPETPRGSCVPFFVVTFAITWPCFALVALISRATDSGSGWRALAPFLLFAGIFAPAFTAALLTALDEGRAGVRRLAAGLFVWKVPLRWYLFAITFMAAIKLATAGAHRLATGAWPAFGETPWFVILAGTFLSTILGGQAGEELGWRGYALPRLAGQMGFGAASVLLGVFWAVWHLPLFFVIGADTNGQSFPVYLMQVVALSVAIAWLYFKTGGSLLLTMLMHSAVNQSKGIVPSGVAEAGQVFTLSASPVAWLTAGLLWICAGWFLIRMRGAGAGAGQSMETATAAVRHA